MTTNQLMIAGSPQRARTQHAVAASGMQASPARFGVAGNDLFREKVVLIDC
jgi:hypothetical protein